LCVVVLVGCSAGSDLTTPRPNASALTLSARTTPQERVTGSATILLPLFGNALERYSLSAIRQSDGSVNGEFEEFSEQEGGQRIHARVYCFTVTGNSARLAARIDQTNVSFGPVGSYVVWSVRDNGEGAKAPPDETTDIFFGGTQAQADTHCRTGFPLAPYYPSIRGNLQVE
ncbi:MAG TPA: hypothetical protein VJW73_13965, partial [Gemmatimonadaceae bacterium]|nr:hypothetical protein [Gemmatimonadaceae bacterium]